MKKGDTIQERTLYMGGHYLSKYGILKYILEKNSKVNLETDGTKINSVYATWADTSHFTLYNHTPDSL